jgi:hypothetical protein
MIKIRIDRQAIRSIHRVLPTEFNVDFHSYVNTPKVVGRCVKGPYAIDQFDNAGYVRSTFKWLGRGYKPTQRQSRILNIK